MSKINEIITRMCEALSAENDSDLARKLETRPSTISSWRTRDSIPYAECVNISEHGYSLDWLLTGRGPKQRGNTPAMEMHVDVADPMPRLGGAVRKTKTPASEFAFIPFFDIPVSAGAGCVALDAAASHYIAYRHDYLHRRGLVAGQLIELPIAGDSMSPELENGDTVLVDKSRTNIAGDGIYVLAIDELLFCKRLQLLPGKVLRVISINGSYPPFEVRLNEDADSHNLQIIGRVVRQGRDR